MGCLSPGIKELDWKSYHWPHPHGELRMQRALLPLPMCLVLWCIQHQDSFTFTSVLFSNLLCTSVSVIFYVIACVWHLNYVANLVLQIHVQHYLATCMTLRLIHLTAGRAALTLFQFVMSFSNRFFLTIFKEMVQIVSSGSQHTSHVKTCLQHVGVILVKLKTPLF